MFFWHGLRHIDQVFFRILPFLMGWSLRNSNQSCTVQIIDASVRRPYPTLLIELFPAGRCQPPASMRTDVRSRLPHQQNISEPLTGFPSAPESTFQLNSIRCIALRFVNPVPPIFGLGPITFARVPGCLFHLSVLPSLKGLAS